MTDSVREAFDKATEAFNAHDIEAFAQMLAEDVVSTAPGGMVSHGRAASAAFYGIWFEAFPDARADVHKLVITDDTAVEEGTFSGTHNGVFHTPMGDIPPTGKAVKGDYIQVLRYRDGLCVSANLMFDRLDLLEQLGLIPAPAAAG
jgi:steroid delta-isomerase-like uncharacterized protein